MMSVLGLYRVEKMSAGMNFWKLESTITPLWMKIAVIMSFMLSVISIFLSLAKF